MELKTWQAVFEHLRHVERLSFLLWSSFGCFALLLSFILLSSFVKVSREGKFRIILHLLWRAWVLTVKSFHRFKFHVQERCLRFGTSFLPWPLKNLFHIWHNLAGNFVSGSIGSQRKSQCSPNVMKNKKTTETWSMWIIWNFIKLRFGRIYKVWRREYKY